MDIIFTPLCSVARVFGLYRLADRIFRLGPHELAIQLGACGYYYDPEEEKRLKLERLREERRAEAQGDAAIKSLKLSGYILDAETLEWIAVKGRKPTEQELFWIEMTPYNLKVLGRR